MTDSGTTYRILREVGSKPSEFLIAPPRHNLRDAVADMGGGLVVDDTGRLVAFHERHLDYLQRRAAAGLEILG